MKIRKRRRLSRAELRYYKRLMESVQRRPVAERIQEYAKAGKN